MNQLTEAQTKALAQGREADAVLLAAGDIMGREELPTAVCFLAFVRMTVALARSVDMSREELLTRVSWAFDDTAART